MSDYMLVQSVTVEPKGSTLTTAALTSEEVLVVDSAQDFDDEGGTLDLNGARLQYTSIVEGVNLEDPDTINLAAPLAADAGVDDAVSPVVGGLIPEDWYAVGTMGEDGGEVTVPLDVDQRAQWPVGDYPDPVPVRVSDDLSRLEDAPGRTVSTRNAFRNTDTYTYDGVADRIELPLTKMPISGSEQPYWSAYEGAGFGQAMPPETWFIEGNLLVINDGYYMGQFAEDDLFWVTYAWDQALDDIQRPPQSAPTPALVIAEGFETGTLGDYLRLADCPGLTSVYAAGGGTFVADPHSGDQAALLFHDSGGGSLTPSTLSLDVPDVLATEVGLFFKAISGAPATMTAKFMVGSRKFTGLGSPIELWAEVDTSTLELRVREMPISGGGSDNTYTLVQDDWYELNGNYDGDWVLTNGGGVVASGSVGATPENYALFASALGQGVSDASFAGDLVTDDFYYRPPPDIQ